IVGALLNLDEVRHRSHLGDAPKAFADALPAGERLSHGFSSSEISELSSTKPRPTLVRPPSQRRQKPCGAGTPRSGSRAENAAERRGFANRRTAHPRSAMPSRAIEPELSHPRLRAA